MQTVTYYDPNGRSIFFSPKARDYIFESIEGIGGIQSETQTVEPYALHGSLLYGARAISREIILNFHVHGKDRRELYRLREECQRVLSPLPSEDGQLGKFEYSNDAGTWWIPAMVLHGPEVEDRRLENYILMTTVFYCPDPFWRASELMVENLGYLGGAFIFPLIIPLGKGIKFGRRAYKIELWNSGNSPTPIQLTIEGPALTPTIIHHELNTKLEVRHRLNVGDKMIIDTTPGQKRVTIILENGETKNAMQYISPDSNFIQLRNGMNTLEYQSGDDTIKGHVTVSYWPKFGGV